MAKIIKSQIETLKMVKLIGKRFKGDLFIPGLWKEWFKNNCFDFIDKINKDDVDDNNYIGLFHWNSDNPKEYEYWIGVFVNNNIQVPNELDSITLPSDSTFVTYIKGQDNPNLYNLEGQCLNILKENNFKLYVDINNTCFAFERYNCPRFTTPDENNEVILDYVILIK